ncbi:MAG: 4-alpha-glucanotransferase [Gemmataceae bacterium]|nr:4-alpha-glucanotransferase [Gemmata sp.]MDW8198601.1 4-alpha-glucanotransferase [Gemmataceae bacterium]
MSSPTPIARSSGILLHLTSLPGPFGIGDLGPGARQWLDSLAAARQRWWQVLPVVPTGYGDSPYQSPSTFAGNLNFLSPEVLAAEGLVSATDVTACELPAGPIHYAAVIAAKKQLLALAYARFRAGAAAALRVPFQSFCDQEAAWLNDYALFVAIKDHMGGRPWWQWPQSLAQRDPDALRTIREKLAEAIETYRFGQFLFFRQWTQLRAEAHQRGIRLLGDIPIYVADDSADVWAHPELFLLDENRRPLFVAGVPPDYFSRTGQLWGNPVYDWNAHRRTVYRWWVARLQATLRWVDLVRIDHFRGIEAYWAVPAGDATAENGRWVPGPREELLEALRTALGQLPVVAEDLGFITPEVDELRERFHLPGMRVLQFAFGGEVEARFLPHRYSRNLLVTTGTHDNDTTRGWFEKLTAEERGAYEAYVPEATRDPVWALIRTGWASVADVAVAPLQDVLELGSEARLNTPGVASGNWVWRASEAQITDRTWIDRLAEYTQVYER